jgi:uncharacterized protein
MRGAVRLRTRFVRFIIIIQLILFAAHGFVYETWMAFERLPVPFGAEGLQTAMAALSVTFVPASLLAFRWSNFWTKLFYKLSAAWLGLLNFLVLAAGLCWIFSLGEWVLRLHAGQPVLAEGLYGLAALTGFCGILNARLIRLKRIKVKLPNLPPSWRGRTAALVSDLHLGQINGRGFIRKVVARLIHLRPDALFIAGDFFDGVKVSAGSLASELKHFSAPFGAFFVTGNHEEFSDPAKYVEAMENAGVRVLKNERVTVDGLDIIGVHYGDSVRPERLRSILQGAGLRSGHASVLIAHAPHQLEVAEQQGVSLQLSGHTHAGQFYPFVWLIRRIFRQYAYGLNRFGKMMVYTSSGCGTWGPPMRAGTRPEIVLIEFE